MWRSRRTTTEDNGIFIGNLLSGFFFALCGYLLELISGIRHLKSARNQRLLRRIVSRVLSRPYMPRSNTTEQIIGAAIKIHRRLGPGLLESAYEACLFYELDRLGLEVQRQRAIPLIYESVKLECGFRADLIVNREVIVEIKCKESIHPVD